MFALVISVVLVKSIFSKRAVGKQELPLGVTVALATVVGVIGVKRYILPLSGKVAIELLASEFEDVFELTVIYWKLVANGPFIPTDADCPVTGAAILP